MIAAQTLFAVMFYKTNRNSMLLNLFRRLFVRQDACYTHYETQYQARSRSSQLFYLFFYLLPGLLAYVAINIPTVYQTGLRLTGLPGNYYQYGWFLFITFGWHIFLPFIVLRYVDKLSWRQSLAFLSLDGFDWRGCTYLLAIVFVLFTLLSLPYMAYLQRPLYQWLDSIPRFRIPDYSIFKSTEALYGYPMPLLLLLLIGNFVGEEVYFRGYLLKKTAFLDKHNVWINGTLFAIYHFFQIPQTWPLIIPSMAFPLLMVARKNLYVVIIFHLLVNLVWSSLLNILLPLLP